jgi:hypothetical protein
LFDLNMFFNVQYQLLNYFLRVSASKLSLLHFDSVPVPVCYKTFSISVQ